MKVALSREKRSLGAVTFWRGVLDFEEITDPSERHRLEEVLRDYVGKPFTYAWGGREGQWDPLQHEPETDQWFRAVLLLVLRPEGYRYEVLDDP